MMSFKVGDRVVLKEYDPDTEPELLEITAIYPKKNVVMLKGIDKSWSGATGIDYIEKAGTVKPKPVKREQKVEKPKSKPKPKQKKEKKLDYYWP